MSTVFLDSSVLFTATNSPTGGSAKLFTLSHLQLVTSSYVLTEVERNVELKLQTYHRKRFFHLVNLLNITVVKISPNEIQIASQVIAAKDAYILAQVKASQFDFLATLDRKDFFSPKVHQFIRPTQIVTPKDLIENQEDVS